MALPMHNPFGTAEARTRTSLPSLRPEGLTSKVHSSSTTAPPTLLPSPPPATAAAATTTADAGGGGVGLKLWTPGLNRPSLPPARAPPRRPSDTSLGAPLSSSAATASPPPPPSAAAPSAHLPRVPTETSITQAPESETASGGATRRSSLTTKETQSAPRRRRRSSALPPAAVPPTATRDTPLRTHFLSAQLPFVAFSSCVMAERAARDWNGEFQVLWTEQVHNELCGYDRDDALAAFLDEFESHAKGVAEAHVAALDDPSGRCVSGGDEAPAARYGNVFAYVWSDAKVGMWMQRSYRAFLECRVRGVAPPLLATFRFFNLVVTVAAVLPLDRNKVAEYAGTGRGDAVVCMPLQEHLDMVQAALNLVPDGKGKNSDRTGESSEAGRSLQQRKIRGVEVREGLDIRLYLTNCVGLLPPIFSPAGKPLSLRRWRHLVQHQPAPWGSPAFDVYKADAAAALQFLPAVLEVPVEKRNARLVEVLHANGLNVCMLGLIAVTVLFNPQEDLEDISELVLFVMCTEMLARAVRRSMFASMRQERCTPSVKTVNAFLERAAGSLLNASTERFREGLLPLLQDNFWLDDAAPAVVAALMARLRYVLRREPTHVMRRICQLCGLQVLRGSATEVLCTPSHHNYSSLFSPAHDAFLSSLGKEGAAHTAAFTCAFVVPLRIRFLYRNGRLAEAWREVRRLVELRGRNLNERFLNSEAWSTAALFAARCGREADSAVLIARAADVVNSIPAYVVQSAASEARLPSYLYYLTGQVYVKIVNASLLVQQGKLEAAEEKLEEALRLPDVFEPSRQYFLGHLRQHAIIGLFSIATRSSAAKVRQFDAVWSSELRTMAPTLQGAHISELFGSLFFERDMFSNAVGRLWECLETTEQLLGPTALRVGEVLNKLAYVYYCWDARQYGLFCACILHRAEEIMRARTGAFSPLHLSVLENIISLFIQRGMFVEASQRLHELRTLPARYTARIPRDHPVMTRIAEIEAKLRADFRPFAIDIIQRCWRVHYGRRLVRAECERNVREIQRVGRAYRVRRMAVQLYYGTITPEVIVQRTQTYSVLSFSRPLITASALFDKDERHWNSEAQHLRLFAVAWDQLEYMTVLAAMQRVEGEFAAAAMKYLLEMRRGTLRGTPVAGCTTSVVAHNMVFTQVPTRHRLSELHVCLSRFMRRRLQTFTTAPLCTVVEFEDCSYRVEALIPLHHEPQFVLTAGGRRGVRSSPPADDFVRYFLPFYRDAGLTHFQAEGLQAVEVVHGTDELLYVTNLLGFVSVALQQPDMVITEDRLPRDHFLSAWHLWSEGKMREAMELLEHTLLDLDATQQGSIQVFFLAYFASARFALGDDADAALRLFQRCSKTLEEQNRYLPAVALSHVEGRAWMHRDAPKMALEPFLRSLRILKTHTHLHAYFGSFFILETARWALLASNSRDSTLDPDLVSWVARAVEVGEPTLNLFTTCGRFIVFFHARGDTALTQQLVKVRDARAKELPPAERARFVRVLQEQSEDLQRRGGTDCYKDCAFLLQTAICLAEVGAPDSKVLGVLLTSYGFLLTTMDKLKDARRFLRRASAILTKTVSSASPEMMTWHKNNRILNHRVRESAIRVIRRAVWRWKERRRLDKRMEQSDPAAYRTLMAVRFQRRLNRLVVVEATARVLIAEGQSEEWYRLLRRQGRMRNEAMLKQTYGSRVQIFNDKVQSALQDLAELAFATKTFLAEAAWGIRGSILSSCILTGHRLERRATIAEWHRDRISLKLWHIENVDLVIRAEFLSAFHGYVVRCVSAEEKAWRRIILRNQKKTKRQLAKAIVHALHRKPKSAAADLRSLLLDEGRKRERIVWRENEDFRQLRDAFNFGPVVEDVDVEADGDETEDSSRA